MTQARVPQKVFLSLGSNERGDVKLPEALLALHTVGAITAASHVYESAAVPPAAGPAYLNAAVCLTTELDPLALKDALRAIERSLGRDRSQVRVPIDVDICLYGRAIVHEHGLAIPHPLLSSRAYMAVPAAECDPAFRHPETHETLAALAERVQRAEPATLRRRTDVVMRRW